MRKYLLSNDKNFYKANIHTHTNVSDGKFSPEEVKAHYLGQGYSVVAFTDHGVFIPHNDLTDENFVALNGYEIEANALEADASGFKKTCHMCLIATKPDMETPVCWHREKYLFGNAIAYRERVKNDPSIPDYERSHTCECVSDMMRLGRENGFFVSYNHPTWSYENYEDYIGYDNMHAMEIVNFGCVKLGYAEHNERVYDDMLRAGKKIYCLATDDSHNEDHEFGGYIMLKAKKLEYECITDALLNGDFYSSEGPEIKELYVEDGKVYIKTSDASLIRFTTGGRRAACVEAEEGKAVNEASFDIFDNLDVHYFRITVVDKSGKCAYTNAYFTKDFAEN